MLLLPVRTPLLRAGDDLAALIGAHATMEPQDIVVISSKAVATVEGATLSLAELTPSAEAEEWSRRCGRSAAFCTAVLQEVRRMHGTIQGACPGAILTDVRPDGLERGSILIANAGLDESNTPSGTVVGWPCDPVSSIRKLRNALEAPTLPSPARRGGREEVRLRLAMILTDSCLHPRRLGVIAFAMAVSGMDPVRSEVGRKDLFGKELRVTNEATADQLATAANFLMGNAEQSCPAVIIRDHGLPMTKWEGWVPGIEPEEDFFRATL